MRGTVLGSILGILPGGGAVIASFAAYTLEKKISRTPQRFGRGAIEGVAAPESANNAAAQTSFIPLLTLGIPPNAVMALMVGAMTIHGIVPGPQVMQKQPELVWGMGRGRARAESGRSARQCRLFLCDISPAQTALTSLTNVCIDNYGLNHSCLRPEACVVRALAVPYKAGRICEA